MTDQQRKIYGRMYDELIVLSHKLDPYYGIERIKDYGIYVWGPDSQGHDANIFDIYSNEIRVWRPGSIIAEIIQHLKKMEKYRKECEK